MQAILKITIIAVAVVLGTAGAVRAVPKVSNVRMAQITGSRLVKITYDLADEDAIITVSIETNGVAIPDSAVRSLYDDVCKVVHPGSRSILWNAGQDWPENVAPCAKALVTAWSTNAPPLYCAVDVTGGPLATNYPVYYHTSADAVPRGVTNDLYKTDRILMRRIAPTDAIGFIMGEGAGAKQVFLMHGFYAGVFQVTQMQWQQVIGDLRPWPSWWDNNDYRSTRPVEQVTYFEIRENPNNSAINPNWPHSDAVGPDSFMGRLQQKTGRAGFDLPTEAQWEYACRAGTTGALNDGTMNLTNNNSDARLDLLGRYTYNGGKVNGAGEPDKDCGTENATAAVGSYAPNSWGLYDMHGNVFEWCLDRFGSTLPGNKDPVGDLNSSARVRRGGSYANYSQSCTSATRLYYSPDQRGKNVGFRIVRVLP